MVYIDNDTIKAPLGVIQGYYTQEQLHILQSLEPQTLLWWALALTLGAYFLRIYLQPRKNDGVVASYVGFNSPYEPSFVARLRFLTDARRRIFDGYARVCDFSFSQTSRRLRTILTTPKFGDSRFKVPRSDADVLVISNKYLDEVRSLPDTTANPIQAHIDVRLLACSQSSSHRSLLIRRGIRTSEANTRLLVFS